MRTTVTLNDEIYEKALMYRPDASLKELLNEALKSFIQLESGRRLAKLAGSSPESPIAPPRRTF